MDKVDTIHGPGIRRTREWQNTLYGINV